MITFQPNLNILPQEQKLIWPLLSETKNLGMVLYGGTALALQLGHRQSVDFDFFTTSDISHKVIVDRLPMIKDSRIIQSAENSFTYLVKPQDGQRAVQLSFFGGIDFGIVNNPIITNDGVLKVASLDDLMANKLKVIMQRVEVKDYVDIAAMISSGVSLAKGLSSARSMFGSEFSAMDCLKALTYFKGSDLIDLDQGVRDFLTKSAKTDLIKNLPKVVLMKSPLSGQTDNLTSKAISLVRNPPKTLSISDVNLKKSIKKSMTNLEWDSDEPGI